MTAPIAIVTDEPGWHGERLREAFVAAGHGVRFVSLRDCRIEIGESVPRIVLPGFESYPRCGVFVRGIPGGSLEEIIFYLDILHGLRQLGVVVYNDARSIERTVDKAMTSFMLQAAGIPTPATFVVRDMDQARSLVAAQATTGYETVLKPLFGSQGQGLMRVRRPQELETVIPAGGVFYLQRFIDRGEDAWFDWRVFVIGGHAVAAMRRNGANWITNVKQGAHCQAALLDGTMRHLAERSVHILGLNYAGVDLIQDRDGKLWVLEVNSIPAWKGLQSVCAQDIAARLADDFLAAGVGSFAQAVG